MRQLIICAFVTAMAGYGIWFFHHWGQSQTQAQALRKQTAAQPRNQTRPPPPCAPGEVRIRPELGDLSALHRVLAAKGLGEDPPAAGQVSPDPDSSATQPGTVAATPSHSTDAEVEPAEGPAVEPEQKPATTPQSLPQDQRKPIPLLVEVSPAVYQEMVGRARGEQLQRVESKRGLVLPTGGLPAAGLTSWRRHFKSDVPGGQVTLTARYRWEHGEEGWHVIFTGINGIGEAEGRSVPNTVDVVEVNGNLESRNLGETKMNYKLRAELGRIGGHILFLAKSLPVQRHIEGSRHPFGDATYHLAMTGDRTAVLLNLEDATDTAYPREPEFIDEMHLEIAANGAWLRVTRLFTRRCNLERLDLTWPDETSAP